MIASTQTDKQAPHVSASQIRTYGGCSLQWFFSRHHRPEHVGAALPFGSAMHRALEVFYQGRLEGREVDSKTMRGAFLARWKEEELPVQYGKKDTEKSLLETAGRMIDAFLTQVTPGTVVALEERFEVQLADELPPLVGFIDMVETRVDPDGVERCHLVDFKTAGRRPSGPADVDAEQLVLYGIGACRSGLLKEIGLPLALRYDILTKVKKPELVSISINPDRADALRLIEKVKVCWRGMQAGICFPQASWRCAGCGYRSMCAKWPELAA